LVEQPTQFKSQDPHDGAEHAADDGRETGPQERRCGAVEDGGNDDAGQQVQRQQLWQRMLLDGRLLRSGLLLA
jgi:hypothetical protein